MKKKPADRHKTPRSYVVISKQHSDILDVLALKHRRTRKAQIEVMIEAEAKRGS